MGSEKAKRSAEETLGQASDAVRQRARTASATTASAASSASEAASHASDVGATVTAKAGEAYSALQDKVHDVADSVGSFDVVDRGRAAYRTSSKELGRRVGKQPMEALLLAGAIGYLLGWAFSRG